MDAYSNRPRLIISADLAAQLAAQEDRAKARWKAAAKETWAQIPPGCPRSVSAVVFGA